MNQNPTIEIILSDGGNGSVQDIRRDFSVHAGGYDNIDLHILVPKSYIIEPNDTAVTIGAIITKPDGSETTTEEYTLPYIDDAQRGSVLFSVFGDKLSEEIMAHRGDQDVTLNITSINGGIIEKLIPSQTITLPISRSRRIKPSTMQPSEAQRLSGQINSLRSDFQNHAVLKFDANEVMPDYIQYNRDGFKTLGVYFFNETHGVPLDENGTHELNQGGVIVTQLRRDADSPNVIGYQDEIFCFDGGTVARTITLNISQMAIGQYVVLSVSDWLPLNFPWLNDLGAKIAYNTVKLSDLSQLVLRGIFPVGSTTFDHYPTDDELDAFTLTQTGREPRVGDRILFTVIIYGQTNQTYEAIFSGGEYTDGEIVGAAWSVSELQGVQLAENNEPGLIEGTNYPSFLVELTSGIRKMLVDINDGSIDDIIVSDASGRPISLIDHAVISPDGSSRQQFSMDYASYSALMQSGILQDGDYDVVGHPIDNDDFGDPAPGGVIGADEVIYTTKIPEPVSPTDPVPLKAINVADAFDELTARIQGVINDIPPAVDVSSLAKLNSDNSFTGNNTWNGNETHNGNVNIIGNLMVNGAIIGATQVNESTGYIFSNETFSGTINAIELVISDTCSIVSFLGQCGQKHYGNFWIIISNP
jgi:hypothetical protein